MTSSSKDAPVTASNSLATGTLKRKAPQPVIEDQPAVQENVEPAMRPAPLKQLLKHSHGYVPSVDGEQAVASPRKASSAKAKKNNDSSVDARVKKDTSGVSKHESQDEQTVKPAKKKLHKAGHDPRAAALLALWRVLHESVDAQAAVDEALGSHELMPTDKRLCTELVYGTLRQYIRLEWFTRRCLAKPDKLPSEMYLCLIMSLYALTFLRMPHHGTVDWAVTHIKNRFGVGMGKVANGTLRTLQRRLRDFHKSEFYANECASKTQALSCQFAMPEWIVDLWLAGYGEATTMALLKASQSPAPSGLRLNRLNPLWQEEKRVLLETEYEPKKQAKHLAKYANVNTADGTDAAQDAPLEDAHSIMPRVFAVPPCGLAFTGTLPWHARNLAQEGKATRQSAASYTILEEFTPKAWQQPIWDACAGRGGKTTLLLEMGIPVALATDPAKHRLAALQEELARLHIPEAHCPVCMQSEAQEAFPLQQGKMVSEGGMPVEQIPSRFGTILIDAPCSGLGTLSRHPEIRLRRTPEDVANLVVIQAKILDAAYEHLVEGGQLVYLTCTMSPQENEQQIAAFIAKHSDMHVQKEYTTPAESNLNEFFYGAMLKKS